MDRTLTDRTLTDRNASACKSIRPCRATGGSCSQRCPDERALRAATTPARKKRHGMPWRFRQRFAPLSGAP
ncbi:hypothetical protein [Burkholderia paludis]|uniref:hypothetical protein n=1 Tax=Burkholderia paludis TaxID=1506587 RepID=UPI001269FBB0|nr:hypothetical protein [Burkholderia paludis]